MTSQTAVAVPPATIKGAIPTDALPSEAVVVCGVAENRPEPWESTAMSLAFADEADPAV